MAASKGRSLLIKRGSTVIAGVRSKGVAINNEPIDITSDDDLGYRTLLTEAGTMSIDLSVEGVSKDATLLTLAAAGGTGLMLTNVTVEYSDGGIIAGNFFLNSFENTGPYNEAVTFTASLQSSGAFTYTP
jgi:predicted secreted protein